MAIRCLIGIAALGLTLASPVYAQSKDAFDRLDAIAPETLFKGVIREDDATLLFRHLRESLTAAARGEAPRESEAFERRSAEIGRELTQRGSVLMSALLDAFEGAVKQAIREGFGDAPKR